MSSIAALLQNQQGKTWESHRSYAQRLDAATNQLVLGADAHKVTISSTAPASSALTYTLPDAGASCNLQLGIRSTVSFAAATASQSLSIAQSGSLCFLPQCTANVTVTLPAATAGWHAKVILTGVPDGTHTVTFTNGSAVLSGVRYGVVVAPVGVSAVNQTNLILGATAANAAVGDYVEFWSDGTKIYYRAWTNGTAAGFSTS